MNDTANDEGSETTPDQVYESGDEALADPDLDLSRPWFVAPPPLGPDDEKADVSHWPEAGLTSDIPLAFRREP